MKALLIVLLLLVVAILGMALLSSPVDGDWTNKLNQGNGSNAAWCVSQQVRQGQPVTGCAP
jgi:preprotein translocase subunit SecG